MTMRQRSLFFISLVLVSLLLAGCPTGPSPSSQSDASYETESAPTSAPAKVKEVVAEDSAGSPVAHLVNETTQTERWLVRNGQLTLEVQDIPEARKEAIRLIRAAGGYVETESMSGQPLRSGTLTARVPVQKYESVMEDLKANARVLTESTNTEDVTTQAVDAQARLKALRAEEESLLGLYGRARNVEEILKLRGQLSTIRQEIESVDARIKSLARMSALSTIEIRYRIAMNTATNTPNDWASRAFQESFVALQNFMRGLADIGIRFLVFVPVWGPIVFAFWWLVRRAKRTAEATAQ